MALLLQQFQRLEVLTINQQSITFLIHILHAPHEFMLELGTKELRVKYKERVVLQEFLSQWFVVTLCHYVALYLVNGEKAYPLLALRIIGDNLWVKGMRDAVERDAVITTDNKLLFQPEFLLEVFELGKESDDFLANLLDGFHLCQMLQDVVGIKIVQEHYFVLDIKIQLTAQESTKVLMDEIIEIVFRGIVLQMLHQQTAVFVVGSRTFYSQQLGKIRIR